MTSAPLATEPTKASWEADICKARDRVAALRYILGPIKSLDALQESERPGKGLLEDELVSEAIIAHMSGPGSGHGDDALCKWLYDTFQSADRDLEALALRFVPTLCRHYLSRITSCATKSVAGFEAVLLALYNSETKSRNGRSLFINIPDLAQPSLYHTPRISPTGPLEPRLGQLASPLEPQDAVKATKRACIVGVALDLFCRKIAIMPHKAKIEACQCALRCASLSSDDRVTMDVPLSSAHVFLSPGRSNLDVVTKVNDHPLRPSPSSGGFPEIEIVGPGELFLRSNSSFERHPDASLHQSPAINHAFTKSPQMDRQKQPAFALPSKDDTGNFVDSLMQSSRRGVRVLLPWELLQPLLKIIGHCLLAPLNSQEVKDAASIAIQALHCRAACDLAPEALLATRSLMRLDMAARTTLDNHLTSVSSASSSKSRKPDVLLVAK